MCVFFFSIIYLRADDSFPEVSHEPDQGRVPLVSDLGERCASRGHEHLPDAVLEGPDRRIVHPQEGLTHESEGKKKKV